MKQATHPPWETRSLPASPAVTSAWLLERPACSQTLSYVTLQHPRTPGEHSSKVVPAHKCLLKAKGTLNLNLLHSHSAQTYVSVQDQTSG